MPSSLAILPLAITEIGRQLPRPAIVFGEWGVESVLESWQRSDASDDRRSPGSGEGAGA